MKGRFGWAVVGRVSASALRGLWRTLAGKLGRFEKSPGPSYHRGTVLRLLNGGPCVFCSGEREAAETYFRWFIAEKYAQPEVLATLARSRGFCPQHTRLLVTRSSPSQVVSVYSFIVESLLVALRRPPGSGRKGLPPAGPCPACEDWTSERRLLVGALLSAAADPQIPFEPRGAGGMCVSHLRELCPTLPPQGLRLLTGLAVRTLTAAYLPPEPWEAGIAVWGEPGDVPAGAGSQECGGLSGPNPEAEPAAPWPSPLAAVHGLLRTPGCPVCFGEQAHLRWYLSWLVREATKAPEQSWEEARWLCRKHWHALRRVSFGAARRVAAAAAAYWEPQLRRLGAALAQGAESVGGWRIYLRRGFSRSAGAREAYLWAGRCPACDAAAAGARSACELLAAVLEGNIGRRAYERMGGVCLRHLPFVLEYCPEPRLREFLLGVCQTQLRILKWELAEYQRKESWSARYEPKAAEAGVWLKATAYLGGLEAVPYPLEHGSWAGPGR
jgi:hypothetical protein